MNAPEAAAKEAERVLKNGANAIQLATNANGEPIDEKKFWPIYEVIEKSGKPILLHPSRTRADAGLSDREPTPNTKSAACSAGPTRPA